MEYKIKSITKIIVCFILSAFFFSCDNEPSDSPYVSGPKESTLLIYAVATNSLRYNFTADTIEMVLAAPEIDLQTNNVLIYATTYEHNAQLLKLEKTVREKYNFKVVKEYSSDISSLNPQRVEEVMEDLQTDYPADTYGLIFWSHSTASQPYMNGLTGVSDLTMSYSFGQDKNQVLGETFEMNIDVLADALPDNFFHFIWFDSCYMSNVESIYEFRNKCNYFIGYPTEVVDEGNPYHLILPIIARKNPDLTFAAKTFFNYFSTEASYRVATIALVDMAKMEEFANFCSNYYLADIKPSVSSLFKYTRSSTGPFYDLGDYSKAMAYDSGNPISDQEWNRVLNELVLYKAATTRDFNGNIIPQDRFSGISTHLYDPENLSTSEQYYKSLSWYKTTFH